MRFGRFARKAVAAGVALVMAASLAGSASAESGADMPDSHPFLIAGTGLSANWAGWASYAGAAGLAQNGAVSYVKGEWVVPAVKCDGQDADSSIWVGIDGLYNGMVEQIGTQQSCKNGSASYKAWWETYPSPKKNTGLAVGAGDNVRAEVTYIGGDRFVLALTNLTTGQSFRTTQTAAGAPRQTAEWIVEAPYNNGVLPLANFGSVTIDNGTATINGRTGPISSSGLLSILNTQGSTMTDLGSLVKAAVTNPALSGNDNFRATWVHR